ncbi:MAG TPA: GntG family PLP-dependent aldolase [Vicinamibacteria bacterium]|nr:GntG family PLP-dependent aldolase [Vicinamibacteria bacterium]
MVAAVDLRSDTVTRPTPEMRRAMAEAEVGDDLFGEDPTVNLLQDRAARLLGFEAALFVPSGVMGNEIAIRLLTRPGDEVLAEERSHVVQYELAGMAALSGVMPRTLVAEDGILTPALIRKALRPRVYYRSEATLAVLENTHNLAGGTVYTVEATRAAVAACRDGGLAVHIDGARVWNAAVALGVEARRLLEGADTAMVTLSKGLCAPVGSLLLSSRDRIEQARRVRKQLGGGMRQVGVIAAAGLVAIETMTSRLADDHAHARLLADALTGCAGVRVAPAATNIVVAALPGRPASQVVDALAGRGVLAAAMDERTLRLVTHRDVSRADCERAAEVIVAVLGRA